MSPALPALGAARFIACRSVWQKFSLSWLPVSVRIVPPSRRNGCESLLQMADRLAQSVRSSQFAEQVAGDEQDIDFFRAAVVGHALDGLAEIVGAIDAAESVGQVPIGGVQDVA